MMDVKYIFGSLFFAVTILSVSCFSRDDLFLDHADKNKQYIQESYMEGDLFAKYDEPYEGSGTVGTSEGTSVGTSDGTFTTSTTTTTTATPTTTRPDREVPDISGEIYNMDLSLKFNSSCSLTDTCDDLSEEIKDLLDGTFGNHTSEYNFIETVIGSYSSDGTEQFYAVQSIVNYTANYDLVRALEYGQEIIKAINDSVFPALYDKEIDESDIDDTYLQTIALEELVQAGEDIDDYSGNLCLWESENPEKAICEFGWKCVPDSTYNESYGAACEYKCSDYMVNCDQDEGVCTINDAGDPQCGCKDNTLQISSGTCFHQNYLIFICAVGGGVLIIAVIVLVAVLLHRRRSLGEEDRMSRVSAKDILYHERYDADEGQSFQAKQAGRIGLVPSTSSAEREPKPGKSNEPPEHRHQRGHHNQAFDWDDNEIIRLEDLEDNKRRRDYDPYYTELLESESMKDFKPKLDHIDHNKVYAFRRPMFSSKDGEGSSKKTYASRWEDTD